MTGNYLPPPKPGADLEVRTDQALQYSEPYPLAPAEPPEEGVNWGRYIAALGRYKWLMVLIVLLGTGIGVGITQFIKPEYMARSTLWIDSQGGKNGPIQAGNLVQGTDWLQLLRSYQVVDSVVLRLGLFVQPRDAEDSVAFRGFSLKQRFYPGKYQLRTDESGRRYTLINEDGIEVDHGAVGDSIGRPVGFLWHPSPRALKADRTIKFKVLTPRDASTDLMTRVGTSVAGLDTRSGPGGPTFLKVTLTDPDPSRAAVTLNMLDTQFVNITADLKNRQLRELSLILQSQLDTVAQQLHDAEERLKSYEIQVITEPTQDVAMAPGVAATQAPVLGTYFQQKTQLEQLRNDRQALESVLSRLKSGAQTVDAFQTIPVVRTAPNLSGALLELQQSEAELRALRYRYTDEHKPVQDVMQRITELKTQTIPALATALASQLKIQEGEMQKQIAGASQELRAIPSRSIEEARLSREVTAKQALFQEIQSRYETNKLAVASAVNDVTILDEARPPLKPTSNTAPKIILMAFAASLGLAVALALLLDQLDKRFRYPEQVSQELGLPILGAVPALRRGSRRQLNSEEASQVVEAFRTVRLNVAHSYGAGPILLTVSSPGPGDGKSLVSSNLALSFAEAGYRTLLVDGDIRRGELHRMFAIDRRPGLLDYLMGDAGIDDLVRQSGHEGLSIIPCGTRRQQGPELLGSAAMGQLMGEMKSRYNAIIVDSPPLGAGIDPFVLGTMTGNMLVVFRSGETDKDMAQQKLRLLDRLPVRVLGAVLNEIRAEGVYRYYSYLYGYTSDEEIPPQIAASEKVS